MCGFGFLCVLGNGVGVSKSLVPNRQFPNVAESAICPICQTAKDLPKMF